MARQGGFLSGPSVHGTSKLRKHRLKRGVTRDMNAAAGTYVNTKSPMTTPGGFYGAAPKAVGPRFGKTVNPARKSFGKRTPSNLLSRRRRR
jgi:hypothetical protein